MYTNTIKKTRLHKMSQSAREGVVVGMLYDVQNKNVFS